MSGWDVMAGPFSLVFRLMLLMAAMALVRLLVREAWEARGERPACEPVPRAVRDTEIVAAYNDALLAGFAAGEGQTFSFVATAVGTSPDHVRAVIARHWQR
jgi:hypothetical protein